MVTNRIKDNFAFLKVKNPLSLIKPKFLRRRDD